MQQRSWDGMLNFVSRRVIYKIGLKMDQKKNLEDFWQKGDQAQWRPWSGETLDRGANLGANLPQGTSGTGKAWFWEKCIEERTENIAATLKRVIGVLCRKVLVKEKARLWQINPRSCLGHGKHLSERGGGAGPSGVWSKGSMDQSFAKEANLEEIVRWLGKKSGIDTHVCPSLSKISFAYCCQNT